MVRHIGPLFGTMEIWVGGWGCMHDLHTCENVNIVDGSFNIEYKQTYQEMQQYHL